MIHLCPSSHLAEGNSRGFLVDERRLFAVRRDGRAYIYLNRCPHRGIPLEWQPDAFLDDSASLIRCASHGALFLIESGECVAGPCAGERLRALPCRNKRGGGYASAQPGACPGQSAGNRARTLCRVAAQGGRMPEMWRM